MLYFACPRPGNRLFFKELWFLLLGNEDTYFWCSVKSNDFKRGSKEVYLWAVGSVCWVIRQEGTVSQLFIYRWANRVISHNRSYMAGSGGQGSGNTFPRVWPLTSQALALASLPAGYSAAPGAWLTLPAQTHPGTFPGLRPAPPSWWEWRAKAGTGGGWVLGAALARLRSLSAPWRPRLVGRGLAGVGLSAQRLRLFAPGGVGAGPADAGRSFTRTWP